MMVGKLMHLKQTKLFHVFFGFLMVFALSSCGERARIMQEIQMDNETAVEALRALEPQQRKASSLTVDDRPWFGSTAVPLVHGDPLPAKFGQPNSLVVTFEDALTLDQLRIQLQRVTGIRFLVERAAEGGAGQDGDLLFLPSDGREVTGGRVVWQGRLEDLLNQVADTYDASWEYDDGVVTIYQEITKTFVLHSLAQQIGIEGSLEVGQDSGTSSASLPEINIERSQEANIWDEVSDTIQTIIGGRGRFALSPSTGTITVSGPPKVVRRVETYLNEQNALRLRRIAVAIKVLSLDVTNDFSFGADFTSAFSMPFSERAIQFNLQQPSPDGDGNTLLNGLSAGILSGAESATTPENIVSTIQASKDVNSVSIANSGAVVTISDHPAPLQIGTQQNFIEQVSSSSGGEGIAGVSLSPGVITTGLTFNVLPRVIDNNRILLRLDVALTELVNIESFSAGADDTATVIQLPEIDTIGFLQNSILTSGETLVLAGFETNTQGTTEQGTPTGILGFGNTVSTNDSREVTVLLIRAEILPEDPISIFGNK